MNCCNLFHGDNCCWLIVIILAILLFGNCFCGDTAVSSNSGCGCGCERSRCCD